MRPDGNRFICGIVLSMRLLTDRTALIQAVDSLENKGGFAVSLGKTALLADQENLRRLLEAFPEHFTKHEAIKLVWTQQ
jgi:hypothetical protein